MLNKLLEFLRKCKDFNTLGNKMTLGKSEFWADFWKNNREDFANIEKAVLIDRMINGFPSKEYEKGFREGLVSIGEIMSVCEQEEISRQRMNNKTKQSKSKDELTKELTKKRFGIN